MIVGTLLGLLFPLLLFVDDDCFDVDDFGEIEKPTEPSRYDCGDDGDG